MTVLNKHSFAGLSAGALTTASVGTTDTAFNSVNGSGLFVDNSGVRPPRLRFSKVTNTPGYAEDLFSARTAGAFRAYWVPPAAAPSNSNAIITVRNGTAPCFKINLLVANRLIRIMDQGNVQIGSTGTNTYDWDPTKRYRIECKWHHNAGATLGAIELKVFDGDTTTQLGSTISVAAADILTQHTRVLWGMENATPEIGEFFMDDLALADTEAYIGSFLTNVPPSVTLNANDTTPDVGQSITLTVTGSDPDGTIASYAFSQTAGPAVTLSGSGATRTFTAPSVGTATTLTFQAIVTDNEGATSTVTRSVVVNPASNTAPTVTVAASDTTPDPGQTVTLTATGTDTDGTVASYNWSQTAGPTVTLSGTGATRTFVAPYLPADTPLTFSVTATDDDGATGAPGTRTVTVNQHLFWAYTASGRKAILRQAPPAPEVKDPVVITGSIVAGNTLAELTYSVNPGDYNVTGVRFTRTPGSVTTNVSTLSGVQRFSGLTNNTAYTIVATPLINNTPDSSFAQTYLVTPQGTGVPITKVRALGLYNGNYTMDATRTTFGTRVVGGVTQRKDAEMDSRYIQWGVPESDPVASNPPGNPYPDGTWYRDFKPIVWNNFKFATEQAEADRGIWAALNFAPKSSSVIKWIGQGRAANSTGYDWALTNIIDAWVLKAKTVYDYAPNRPMWAFMCGEPEANANQGTYPNIPGTATPRSTDHVDAAKWMGIFLSLFISRARTLAPGMKVGIWLAGFRSDSYVNQMLTAMTVAPDIVAGDPYVNDTANHSAVDNFNDFTDQLRLTGQRWNVQYNRLSNLARPGVAANSGIPIPLAVAEYGVSKANSSGAIMHTDPEMVDFIAGTATQDSIREAMRTVDIEWSIYFNRDSGPNGRHRLDDGSHPLSVAAFRDELFRTDVTG